MDREIEHRKVTSDSKNVYIQTVYNHLTDHDITTIHSCTNTKQVIARVVDNRKVIDEISKENVTSTRKINVKAQPFSSPSFLPFTHKHTAQETGQRDDTKNN